MRQIVLVNSAPVIRYSYFFAEGGVFGFQPYKSAIICMLNAVFDNVRNRFAKPLEVAVER